ncbi:MAG: rhodanese-related sulfurtransferase, partial [Xanthomonadales bacterium]|nr:rhodanese-related sulfurtransferase [Gammaproteobacteria bacterium]NND57085.1 rhodanese-related sulfurtransferase [Xanthomonadales bacterium]NNK51029.1 rhodanese-related sulfurtransferase [Xanthomonadales bacterium]
MPENQTLPAGFLVAAFYKFVSLPDYRELRDALQRQCDDLGLLGSILLAEEGVNGTVSGADRDVKSLFATLRTDPRFEDLHYKESRAGEQPFYRMKVRLKKEIVSLGVEGVDPNRLVGEYVSPQDWNELISRENVRLVDTRNHYEYHLGSFRGAEDPDTASFRDFPQWAAGHLDPEKDQEIAMFCTGGIRCEKATSYLLDLGFKRVYHLDGGILNYLETVDKKESLWEGDCFVFDNRVTVDHDLAEGDFEVCPACRMPLTEEDRVSPLFELHVSCPRCHHRLTERKREGLLERARQIELAAGRG